MVRTMVYTLHHGLTVETVYRSTFNFLDKLLDCHTVGHI